MDLLLSHQTFLVTGASSGFGKAIAERLLHEEANIIAVARREQQLKHLYDINPNNCTLVQGDLTKPNTLAAIITTLGDDPLHGVVFNAGGPPPGSAQATDLRQWDDAYHLVMRWKIALAQKLIPIFKKKQYGRLLFIESGSAKQPIPDLVLSNAFRAGVIGFAKTLSQEVADYGITVNVLAPGAHNSPAIERIIKNLAEKKGVSYDLARYELEESIPVQRLGSTQELSSLAVWLLSKQSGFVTGQTINHDGGKNQSLFG